MCICIVGALWMIGFLMAGSDSNAGAKVSVIPNAGFEQAGSDGLPTGWSPLTMGAPASFILDSAEPHGGRSSVKIEAAEVTRCYMRSEAIPVAPGERLRIAAWARSRGVPPGQGTIIVIAEYDRSNIPHNVQMVATADRRPEWQQIAGTIAVPPGATTMRLRLGLSYSKGTVWWDDVLVSADTPIAARVSLKESRLYPAAGAVPVTILNRHSRKGDVTVRLKLGKRESTATANLTGEPVQSVGVPIEVGGRGKQLLQLELFEGQPPRSLFSAEPVQVVVPPPLTLGVLSPTHWVREDGPPRFEADVEIALDPASAPAKLDVQVLDEHEAAVVRWSKALTKNDIAGFLPITVEAPSLGIGRYRIVVAVTKDGKAAANSEQPWQIITRGEATVTLNDSGFPVFGGKAIYPLGMFNNEGKTEESAAAGFNIVHVYNAAYAWPGQRPDDQRLKNMLDRTQEAGMGCLLLVPMRLAAAGDWEGFTRRIRMFRNHPALLAWDEEEGIARGDMTAETLARIHKVVQDVDPHHPLMIGDSREVIGRMDDRSRFFPAELMDMGMWWWYPFPIRPGQGDDLAGEEPVTRMLLDAPTFLTQRTTDKPVWVGVQAYKKPGAEGRYPTPAEYRAQACMAVIAEAKGLMWYGGSVTGGLFRAVEEGHWEKLKQVVGELAALEPVLMGSFEKPPAVTPADSPVSATIRRGGGRRILLAVNRSYDPVDAAITVGGTGDKTAIVLHEDRSVSVSAGRLHDPFEPLAVHVYELPEE